MIMMHNWQGSRVERHVGEQPLWAWGLFLLFAFVLVFVIPEALSWLD